MIMEFHMSTPDCFPIVASYQLPIDRMLVLAVLSHCSVRPLIVP